MPWGHPGVGTVGPPMPPGPASVGGGGTGCAWGGDAHACVTVGVHTQLRVPDCAPVPQRVSGGVCVPPTSPTLLTPGTSPGQDVGTAGCQHGDTPVGWCTVLCTRG